MNMYQSQVVKSKPVKPKEPATPSVSGYSPTLDTVRMVADTIRNGPNSVMTVAELKRALPRQVNHYALQNALDFMDEIGWIDRGSKGIVWIYNPNPNIARAIALGYEH